MVYLAILAEMVQTVLPESVILALRESQVPPDM
jgi:hypothetical protein